MMSNETSVLSRPKLGSLQKLPPIKSNRLATLTPLDTNFQDLQSQEGKNPPKVGKRKSKNDNVPFAPMEKEGHLQGSQKETTKDIFGKNNAVNGLTFHKRGPITESENDVKLEERFPVKRNLLLPLPSLVQEKVVTQKKKDKKIIFAPMKKEEHGFDMDTSKREKRPRSFLKVRPISSQESNVKREEKSEDDGLNLLKSKKLHIDVADLTNVLHDEVKTDDGSATEGDKIYLASSPQYDKTDDEADILSIFLSQSNEDSEKFMNLKSNSGALVCDPPGGNVSYEDSSEFGLYYQSPSRLMMVDEIQSNLSAESMSETNLSSYAYKFAPMATSPVKSKASKKFREDLEKWERDEEERLEAESKDRLLSLSQSLLEKSQAEERRMKEESAKQLKELQKTLKTDHKRQEDEIRQENEAILESLKSELKDEQSKTVQKLKARNKKRLEQLQAELEVELTEKKEKLQKMKAKKQNALMQESREHDFHRDTPKSFPFVRTEVEQEQKRTLERMSDDHEKEMRIIKEKHSEEKILLKEQLISRFNQEKEQREECLALSLQKLDFEHETEVLKRKQENSDKMLELKKLSSELEVRRNQLESQEAALRRRAERLTKRMSSLEGEDEQEERNMKSPPSQVFKEEAKRDQEEKRQLYVSGCHCDVSLDLLQKSNDELRTCQQEREKLLTMVDQLQRQYNTLSTRMNEFETSSSRSDVKSSKMFNEEPSYKGDRRTGSPPLSSNVDVEHRARRFLKLEADRLERTDSRRRESESPSSRFLSTWSKYRTEYAHNGMVDLNNRGCRY